MKCCALISIPLLSILALPISAPSQTLSDAYQALNRHEIERAAENFSRILEESPNPDDQASARIALATIEWRYYGKVDAARERLLRAAAEGRMRSSALSESARLEISQQNFKTARKTALRALLLAENEQEVSEAKLRFAQAAVKEAIQARYGGGENGETDLASLTQRYALKDAAFVLLKIVENEPGLLEPSRLLLAASLLLHDGESALLAWRSYYRIAPGVKAYGLLDKPLTVLEEKLPQMRGSAPDASDAGKIIQALADSRLFEEAALLALDPTLDQGVLRDTHDIVAYALYTRKIRSITDEYYRKTSIGEGDPYAYARDVLKATVKSWRDLVLPGDPPEPPGAEPSQIDVAFEPVSNLLVQEFGGRFGATVNFGNTAGYFDLHWGHAVVDEERMVEQYGHAAKVRFIYLDGVVSNGFESWAWDFKSQHGGWGGMDRIIQVRPAYADGPINMWLMVSDPERRKSTDERISKAAGEDLERAEKDPFAYLPSLFLRLRLAALDGLLQELQGRGLKGAPLRTAFVSEIERITREYSIFAHEGRHVIDKGLGITDSSELEFRAKLSQITFSESPKLALCGGIISPDIGSDSPHGKANLRIVQGLVNWMESHQAEIGGLDAAKPLLTQLDLLSDDQLREAAVSLDPLAKE
jgi:hypothetical protein